MHPLNQFERDRSAAKALGDPMANLLTCSTIGDDGQPKARILVLREVKGRLAIFCHASSRKFAEFGNSSEVAALVYLPSLGIQYRLACGLERVSSDIVRDQWSNRSELSKRLDALYEIHPQGSRVDSWDWIRAAADRTPVPGTAPAGAVGFYLAPKEIDRLRLRDDGLHDRRAFRWMQNGWAESVFMP